MNQQGLGVSHPSLGLLFPRHWHSFNHSPKELQSPSFCRGYLQKSLAQTANVGLKVQPLESLPLWEPQSLQNMGLLIPSLTGLPYKTAGTVQDMEQTLSKWAVGGENRISEQGGFLGVDVSWLWTQD